MRRAWCTVHSAQGAWKWTTHTREYSAAANVPVDERVDTCLALAHRSVERVPAAVHTIKQQQRTPRAGSHALAGVFRRVRCQVGRHFDVDGKAERRITPVAPAVCANVAAHERKWRRRRVGVIRRHTTTLDTASHCATLRHAQPARRRAGVARGNAQHNRVGRRLRRWTRRP